MAGAFLLGVLGLALGVLKQRRLATRGGWHEFVSCPTICCFSRHDCPSRTVCCDGRGRSRRPVGRVARPEALRKTLRGRPGPHIALLVPAGSDARLPLPSRLSLLCVKRRQGAGAGREGTREVEIRTGSHVDAPPVRWHEVTNIGNTTLQFLNVEKKYRPAPSVSQTVCPSKAR